MKKLLVVLVLMITSSLAIGCNKQEIDVQVSPTFKSGIYMLQGIEGRIGLLNADSLKANEPNKYMWHFWGTKEELARTPFKVEAIDLKTGKKHQVLLEGMGTPYKKSVWEYNNSLGGPNNGADAHLPSGLELPHPGKWQLNTYLGGEFFGSIVVYVS